MFQLFSLLTVSLIWGSPIHVRVLVDEPWHNQVRGPFIPFMLECVKSLLENRFNSDTSRPLGACAVKFSKVEVEV